VSLLSCFGLILTGCSTASISDEAAVARAAEGAIELLTNEDGEDPALVQGVYRGARVCVINARSVERRPLPRLNVIFTKADRVTKEETLVAPGDKICGEAAYSTSKFDVTGEIYMMYEEQVPMKFQGENSYVGASGEIGWNFVHYPCARVSEEPETRVYDSGDVRFTLQRLNDSKDFKEFTVTVSESEGATYKCLR
jgi:hypothetical protein